MKLVQRLMLAFPRAHIFTESCGYLSKTGILLARKKARGMFVAQVPITGCYKEGINSINTMEDQKGVGRWRSEDKNATHDSGLALLGNCGAIN